MQQGEADLHRVYRGAANMQAYIFFTFDFDLFYVRKRELLSVQEPHIKAHVLGVEGQQISAAPQRRDRAGRRRDQQDVRRPAPGVVIAIETGERGEDPGGHPESEIKHSVFAETLHSDSIPPREKPVSSKSEPGPVAGIVIESESREGVSVLMSAQSTRTVPYHAIADGSWSTIDETNGILVADYRVKFFPVPVRSVAFRLPSGGYAVYSPGKGLEAGFPGERVDYLIAANSLHHLGCKAWQAKFPEARMVAAPAAQARLKRHGHARLADYDSFVRDVELKSEIRIHAVPYIKSGDVIVSLPAKLAAAVDAAGDAQPAGEGRAWLACDTLLNIKTRPKRFWQLWMVKIMGEYPGLKAPVFLLGLVLKRDRKAYVDWFRTKFAQDEPSILIPSHGEIYVDPPGNAEASFKNRFEQLLADRFL